MKNRNKMIKKALFKKKTLEKKLNKKAITEDNWRYLTWIILIILFLGLLYALNKFLKYVTS